MAIYEPRWAGAPNCRRTGRYWIADSAQRDRPRAFEDRRQRLVRLGAARRTMSGSNSARAPPQIPGQTRRCTPIPAFPHP